MSLNPISMHGKFSSSTNNHVTIYTDRLCQYPSPADPYYLNFLEHRLMVSLISDQGHYTFLYGHTKHNREGGRKEQTNKHGLWSAPSAREEKFVTLLGSSLCICGLSRAYICAKLPQSH